jgi:hypothetical protein
MPVKKISYLLIVVLFLSSCYEETKEIKEDPVARVQDDYLYPSDLKGLVPQGLASEDSIRISRRLIEEWVRNRLLLKQAELQLPEDQKDIERQVEEYRTSLLIFKYKQNLLARNLDSLIAEEEIVSYYEENSSNFVLEEDVVQPTYLKIPTSAPRIADARRWYRSDREDYQESLNEYCREYAESYIINGSNWIQFTDLISGTPLNIDNPSSFLNYNRYVESSDNEYYYFIRIHNRLREGELKPLSMVRENIRTVLLNKRKLEYIQDLENSVYKEGVSRNQVEIY